MTVGASNRTKTLLAAALFVIAVVMLVRTFAFGPSASANSATPARQATTIDPYNPSGAPAAQPTGRRANRGRRTTARQPGQSQQSEQPTVATLDPRLQLGLLKASEDMDYKGTGRNIFRAEAEQELPKPIVPPKQVVNNTPPPPPQPPPPPPINLKFFGFANKPGEPKSVFLSQGEDVFVAREGDIVNRRYKITRIMPNSIEVEDVLTNNKQSIPLTQG